jgi:hypothetical protein
MSLCWVWDTICWLEIPICWVKIPLSEQLLKCCVVCWLHVFQPSQCIVGALVVMFCSLNKQACGNKIMLSEKDIMWGVFVIMFGYNNTVWCSSLRKLVCTPAMKTWSRLPRLIEHNKSSKLRRRVYIYHVIFTKYMSSCRDTATRLSNINIFVD